MYQKAERVLQRMLGGLSVLHQGLWLGLMDDAHLVRTTMLHYSKSEMYTDREHNLYGLFDWEQAAIAAHFAGCRKILVGSAGAGREVIALAKAGFEVTAFECNPELARRARELLTQENQALEFLDAPPSGLPKGLSGGFDGAILGWAALSHIPGSAARVQMLKALGGQLRREAPLLVSFLPRSGGRRDEVTASIANNIRYLRGAKTRRVEEGDNLMFEFRHMFTQEELSQEFAQAGFRLVHYCNQPYGHAVGRYSL